MLRQKLMEKTNPANTTFRVRGDEVQRIEGFSDAVFGFTVTLLVVSLEVPRTFSELLNTMHDFLAFAVGFGLLVSIWFWQYLFFRRFGLRDTTTILLNAALLFMVLFYAYPLKFLWKLIFDQLLGYDTNILQPNGKLEPVVTESQGPLMMVIYGLGFIAVNTVLGLMYLHAYRQRDILELSPTERFDTVSIGQTHLLIVGISFLSIIIALVFSSVALSGYTYFLVPIVISLYRRFRGRQRRKLQPEETVTVAAASLETPKTPQPTEKVEKPEVKKVVSGQ